MKLRSAKSRTADLFAATPERRPDVSPVALAPQALAQPSVSRLSPKQLWYAAVFPAMAQLDAARTQGPPRAQPAHPELRGALDVPGTRLRDTVTSTVTGVAAAMVMLIVFVIMMLVFCGFWALGTWIGLDEMRR